MGERLFFLHDGRTDDLEIAILAHESPGSEATMVIARFCGLAATDKAALLAFLRGL